LDIHGTSKIFPPFDSKDWTITRTSGTGTHQGDDYFAQDWALDCFSEGKRVYAGISGSLHVNPENDGQQDYYGNTLVIIDYQKGFAQRFAHLESFAPGLRSGDWILAGQFVGRVGATGNVTASEACAGAGGRGAHAHTVLYKNVPNILGRPLVQNTLSGGPSIFAARFAYAAPIPAIKSASSPAVFVRHSGPALRITAFGSIAAVRFLNPMPKSPGRMPSSTVCFKLGGFGP
jgi:murein DD-endopeptidase MepM/ murein hydrolase activator NlpD